MHPGKDVSQTRPSLFIRGAVQDVREELRHRIRQRGRITFAEFTEVALYGPAGGYYSSARPLIGPAGDFYTSPATHPAFGACLALQLRQMWQVLGRPTPFYVVEPGAGDGLLCRDILSHIQALDHAFAESVTYVLVDRAVWEGVERDAPLERSPQRIRAAGLPFKDVVGCILANELLDSFRVHRVMMRDGRLQEVYVTTDATGSFVETQGEPSTPALERRFHELGIRLREGYRTEVNLGIGPWMVGAARALRRGFLLLIDYGHPADVLYGPERSRGTVRCYYRHTLNADPYQRVGCQDISVHVDFTTVMRQGEATGLETLGFITQREFLMNLGLEAFLRALRQRAKGAPPASQRRANVRGMQELIREDGLGAFRVLAMGKRVGMPQLHGFNADNPLRRRLEGDVARLPVPLSTPHHMPFGRAFPGREMEVNWEELWR